jgi:hypothetical protein
VGVCESSHPSKTKASTFKALISASQLKGVESSGTCMLCNGFGLVKNRLNFSPQAFEHL